MILMPRGMAFIDLSWPAPKRSCGSPAAAYILVDLPGVRGHFRVNLASSRRRFTPCGGKITADAIS